MGYRKIQMSFAGGELSPSMYGRFDDQKYQSGLARCRNFIVLPQGPAQTRPGTAYVNAAKYADKACRLIPFTFSSDQTLIVEVGHKYMRFHTNGQTVLDDDGNPYEIETPYDSTHVADIHYVQSMDVMTLVHPYYPPKELRRYGVTDWRLVDINFAAPLAAPQAPTCTYKVVAGKDVTITDEERNRYTLKYKVTALTTDGTITQESPASAIGQTKGNLYLNNATVTLTWPAVKGANRYRLYKNYKGLYCYMGETEELEFVDDNYEPDASVTPPIYEDPFGQDKGIVSVKVTNGGSGYQGIQADYVESTLYSAFVNTEGTTEDEKNHITCSKRKGTDYVTIRCSHEQFRQDYEHKGAHPTYEEGGGRLVKQLHIRAESADLERWDVCNYYAVSDPDGSGAQVLFFFEKSAVSSSDATVITLRLSKILCTEPGSGYIVPSFEFNGTRIDLRLRVKVTGTIQHFYENPDTYLVYREQSGSVDLAKWFGDTSFPLKVNALPKAYVVDPSGQGRGAELGLSCSKGKVSEIVVRAAGSGYERPQVTILGGLGSGATATATVGETGDYPGAVCYYAQRRCFAGTPTRPQMVWMTRSGTEADMSYTLPSKDDNRLRFAIAAQEASRIRHLTPLLQILALTDSTEYRVYSGSDVAVSPTAIKSEVQAQIGASNVQPVVVNSVVVYAAARGGHLRELGYSLQASGFTTGDLSIRSAHLFEDNRITDLALAKAPNPILWAATSNGTLLGFTYLPEQAIGGWHAHDLGGAVESVAAVPEGDEDALYLVVRREVNGATVRYVERMHEIYFEKLEDAWRVDCGGEYEGPATTKLTGLSWLEGETVQILADGAVSPEQVVKDGTVTLDHAATHVIVGLPITADFETLPVGVQLEDGSYGMGHMKNVNDVWLRVVDSSGTFMGPDFDHLTEAKQRTFEDYGEPPELADRELSVATYAKWNDYGQVCVRQVDPLPLTITGISYDLAK